ncbi:MAG TPA: bifunctional 5,10-methylenetetrahydrofolate dehydrogenase/5,10-methenyltetrahydrofolate cyclohydrolase [Candidatus Paceibacterota bacterium]|nr:bifunctional 5,10-methylenetetrahydrofolate dehydrogenase/5,10-methenyltetrahydrofolate cyclohydrolase [Candidatus Paceibacterota bacterium]
MIVDGRQIATEILREVREQVSRTVVVRAIVVAPSPATESYLSIKSARAEEAGMHLEVVRLGEHADPDEVKEWVSSPGCDAVIVQLPLPEQFDTKSILDAIPLERDADVLSSRAYEAFATGATDACMPPVVCAAKEILTRAGIDPRGKRAVVVGQGRLVGEPAATWLTNAGAEVAVITRESGDLSLLKDAEIVVSGAGAPGLIKPEHLSPGVALIDAGTSESGGAIVGDADPACVSVAGVFTPVPGGVGPLAVACLFRNVAALVARPLQEG